MKKIEFTLLPLIPLQFAPLPSFFHSMYAALCPLLYTTVEPLLTFDNCASDCLIKGHYTLI